MASPSNANIHKRIRELANPDEPNPKLAQTDAVLLHWYLVAFEGLDPIEAYDFVFDGHDDGGIDGMLLHSPDGLDESDPATLYLYQAYYPKTPKNVSDRKLSQFVGTAAKFGSPAAVAALMKDPEIGSDMKRLLSEYSIEQRLQEGRLQLRLVFVTAGILQRGVQQYVKTVNAERGEGFLTAVGLTELGLLVEAHDRPVPLTTTIDVQTPESRRFKVDQKTHRVVVCAVRATEIARWPGIGDRTLFDLNVRRLTRNRRLADQLGRALDTTENHTEFLASHNGITVVCRSFDDSDPGKITIKDLSVVNGAQSVIAFADRVATLTDDLQVIVKFCELDPATPLARAIAIRSNTQIAVTNRNLRALDPVQLRIQNDFRHRYPDITYETKPDAANPAGGHVIQNDDAAQLLCAIYRRLPSLAVKKQVLFDEENHRLVFSREIGAPEVRLVDYIARRIGEQRASFPERYRRAWKLTAIVAAYLTGEALLGDKEGKAILRDPDAAFADEASLQANIDSAVDAARATLAIRAKNLTDAQDDFKVHFKARTELRNLGKAARLTHEARQA